MPGLVPDGDGDLDRQACAFPTGAPGLLAPAVAAGVRSTRESSRMPRDWLYGPMNTPLSKFCLQEIFLFFLILTFWLY